MQKLTARLCLCLIVLSCLADGAVPRLFDLQKFIDCEVAAGKTTITVPPGRYEVSPVGRTHLHLKHLSDITIAANGVEMVCTETTRAVWIENCTNLTMRGLSIDYDPLPFTQGRIVNISTNGMVHEIELFDDYPEAETVLPLHYEIFRADTRTLRYGNYYNITVDVLGARRIRVTKARWHAGESGGEEVGDWIVIAAEQASGGSVPHAVVTEDSKNTRFEKVSLYASNCFGFFETSCDRTVYQNCAVDRKPLPAEPDRRTHARLRSLNADAYHSKFAVHGPQLDGCSARFQGDDNVNINGSYHLVIGSESNELTVLAKGDLNIKAGDRVELVSREGVPLPDAFVRSVRFDGEVAPAENKLLETTTLWPQVQVLLKKRYIIEIDRCERMKFGGVICSPNRGNGFRISNCRFGFNRSRGIIVKACDGQIVSNVIENCGMQSILVSPEYQWLEAGYAKNLKIQNNMITGGGGSAIDIHAMGEAPGHQDLVMNGNRLTTAVSPAVVISGVDGMQISENTLNGRPLTRQDPAVDVKNSKGIDFK